jgi:hypothetical protein
MKLKKGGSGEKFPRLEEGTYPSRIVQVVGLGEHVKNDMFSEDEMCDKILITCEYPTELITIDGEEKPRFQSKEVNLIGGEKANLTKIILACDPKADLDDDYEMSELIGKTCLTEIGSTSGDRAKITAWSKPMKGMKVDACMSETMFFDFYEPDVDVFNQLMGWVQDKIKEANNFEGSDLQLALGGGGKKKTTKKKKEVVNEDTVPF